ncbi:MAG: response regulator [Desulfobacteraceae bacterium]|nr:response regulator [Desulfobacteraceae bacterium]MBC2758089.1 response regulator [Desulfobacteraceae bacterium]
MDKKIKVLMVDDEERFRATTNKILTRRGFSTIMAESGEAALEKLGENPDAIILDIKMPGMDGHETLLEIKKQKPDIPVIMLTGHGALPSAEQARKEGAFDYLTKPCDIDVLVGRIKEACHWRETAADEKYRERNVLSVMVPIHDYTTLSGETNVGDAILELRKSFESKVSSASIMETGHRSVMVVDENNKVQGILAISDLLKMILPDYLFAPKPSMADAIQYSPMFWEGMFSKEIEKKATMKIRDVMSPAPFIIDGNASLMEAAHLMIKNKARRLVVASSGDVVGIIREQDLFFEMERVMVCL